MELEVGKTYQVNRIYTTKYKVIGEVDGIYVAFNIAKDPRVTGIEKFEKDGSSINSLHNYNLVEEVIEPEVRYVNIYLATAGEIYISPAYRSRALADAGIGLGNRIGCQRIEAGVWND